MFSFGQRTASMSRFKCVLDSARLLCCFLYRVVFGVFLSGQLFDCSDLLRYIKQNGCVVLKQLSLASPDLAYVCIYIYI